MAKPVVKLSFKNRREFEHELNVFIEKTLPDQHLAIQKKIAIDLFSRIIEKNPVGNPSKWSPSSLPPPKGYVGGRSRANWQISVGTAGSDTSKDPETGVVTKQKISTMQETAGWTAMATAKYGGTIWIYNNVRYITALEHGHSKQAPAGMVAVSLAEIVAGLGNL